MLSIDLERELGPTFNKKRVHVSSDRTGVASPIRVILSRPPFQVIHGMSKDFCSNGLR